MAVSDALARILEENARYAGAQHRRATSNRPASGLAVIACMDARLDVALALGLAPGDAHVLRNAGGLVTDDVIRSLVISQQVVGTDGILIIQHTNCGLEGADEPAIRAALAAELGLDPASVTLDLGSFADADAMLAAQLERLRTDPLLRRVPVHAMRFDIDTGELTLLD